MKPGDWLCPGCNDVQWKKYKNCRQCGTENPNYKGPPGGKGYDPNKVDVFTTNEWWAYCEKYGGGIQDPTKHDSNFVKDFLSAYNGGKGQPQEGYSGGHERVDVGELFVYSGNRSSQWKSAWSAYCLKNNDHVGDPKKHDYDFLIGFMEFMGAHGALALKGVFGDYTPTDDRYDSHPKRQRTDDWNSRGGGDG